MNRSPLLMHLAPALIAARAAFTPIKRSKTARITTERRGTYEYSYAPLDEIQAATDPAMRENGLAVFQNVGGEGISTLILHRSGEFLETDTIPINSALHGTAYGAEVTMRRRYQLSGALNVSVEDDTDAGDDPAFTRKKTITPTSGVLDSLPVVEQEKLRVRAVAITEAFYKVGPEAALAALNESALPEVEYKIALWSLLDSKTRSAIKKTELANRIPK